MLTLNIESTLPDELQAKLTYQQKLFKAKEELERAAKAQGSWNDYTRHASSTIDIYTNPKYLSMQKEVLDNYKQKFDVYISLLEGKPNDV